MSLPFFFLLLLFPFTRLSAPFLIKSLISICKSNWLFSFSLSLSANHFNLISIRSTCSWLFSSSFLLLFSKKLNKASSPLFVSSVFCDFPFDFRFSSNYTQTPANDACFLFFLLFTHSFLLLLSFLYLFNKQFQLYRFIHAQTWLTKERKIKTIVLPVNLYLQEITKPKQNLKTTSAPISTEMFSNSGS